MHMHAYAHTTYLFSKTDPILVWGPKSTRACVAEFAWHAVSAPKQHASHIKPWSDRVQVW